MVWLWGGVTMSASTTLSQPFPEALQFGAEQIEVLVHSCDLRLAFAVNEARLWYHLPVGVFLEHKGRVLVWGLSWVPNGSLRSYVIPPRAPELREMIWCKEKKHYVSLSTQLLWFILKNTLCLSFLILNLGLPHRLL